MFFTLSDLVLDITQNAAESGASLVELEIQETDREFRFIIKDNGRGMDKFELERAIDPFASDGWEDPPRKVGLGIPFLIQTALQSGGGYDLHSEKDKGTIVTAWFDVNNAETPPAGDVPGIFRTILLFESPREIIIRRSRRDGDGELSYAVCKSELAGALGDLEDAGSMILLDRYLKSLEEREER
jgi:hypothetical protein